MSPTCSALSLELGEPLDASAPSERAFLVIEQPGPWGRDALTQSGLPEDVAAEIAARTSAAGLRVQVVRRTKARYVPALRNVWLAYVAPEGRFLEHIAVDDVRALLDLDLDGVAGGRPTGAGTLEGDPIFLACTHGTRDPCCAKHGLPLHRALTAAAPGRVWHASHLGGHRFAATMASLPLGVWLGRVPAAEAAGVVALCRAGRLPLEWLRGRAGEPAAVQAAEIALRREEGIDAADGVSVAAGESGTVSFKAGDGGQWIAHVEHRATGRERPLSCGASAKVEDPGLYEVVLARSG